MPARANSTLMTPCIRSGKAYFRLLVTTSLTISPTGTAIRIGSGVLAIENDTSILRVGSLSEVIKSLTIFCR